MLHSAQQGFGSLVLAPIGSGSDIMMNGHESHTTDRREHLRPVQASKNQSISSLIGSDHSQQQKKQVSLVTFSPTSTFRSRQCNDLPTVRVTPGP